MEIKKLGPESTPDC